MLSISTIHYNTVKPIPEFKLKTSDLPSGYIKISCPNKIDIKKTYIIVNNWEDLKYSTVKFCVTPKKDTIIDPNHTTRQLFFHLSDKKK